MRAHRWQASVYDVLILRCDMPDEDKLEALRSFLDEPTLTMQQANVTDEKPSAAAHRAFRATVTFPPDYLDRMLMSRYARFFFDAESLARWREGYANGGTIIPRDLQR